MCSTDEPRSGAVTQRCARPEAAMASLGSPGRSSPPRSHILSPRAEALGVEAWPSAFAALEREARCARGASGGRAPFAF